MKRPVIFAIALSALVAGAAANAADCKYKTNEIDIFTKERIVKTDWVNMTSWISGTFNKKIGNQHEIAVAAMGEGEQDFVAIRIKLSDVTQRAPKEKDLYHALLVPEESSLAITLADESTVELHADREVRGKTRTKYDDGTFVISTRFAVQYRLDDATANALTGQNAIYIRLAARNGRYEFVSDAGTIDFKVNKKGHEAFRKTISCLRQAQKSEAV